MAFTPDRLVVARERRGLSRSGLAAAASVAERSIRNYESGADVPRSTSVQALADALGLPATFFEGPPLEGLGETAATFRAATKLPAFRRRAALAAGSFAMHLASYLSDRFDLPAVQVPDLDGCDPEVAAEAVRAAWGLGAGPAPSMIDVLESKGVLVFALAEDCRELDAFSFWRWARPFVMLNTMKSAERSRLDAAHELAHLVLHRNLPETTREHEDQAQAFGGAFLLPRAALLASASRGATLKQILAEKKAWRVSATSYTRRLHQLGMLNDWQYRTLMIELTKRGYRSGEPDGVARETSSLMSQALAALREDGIGLVRLADEVSMSPGDVRGLMFGLTTMAL
jgi:Zn-dependent peptidase ImmA (M78 family)/transcriptional regulator with XRE-family HTH domain